MAESSVYQTQSTAPYGVLFPGFSSTERTYARMYQNGGGYTVSWYNTTTSHPEYQANVLGQIYYFVAIGNPR